MFHVEHSAFPPSFCSTWNICTYFRHCIRQTRPYTDNASGLQNPMGRIIAVANQKGGVGKTTTAVNLAASFAAAEVPTLLVDCDPQSNASSALGFAKDPHRLSTYDVLMGAATAEQATQPTALDELFAIPA